MSMQARMSADDQRLYNANRDVAHCFATAVTVVAARLEDAQWPAIEEYLKANGVSDDELGEACAAFIRFIQGSSDNPKEKMADVLCRAGWMDVHDVAQVAYMATLGTVMAGIFFHGVREATVTGFEGPLAKLGDLQAAGSRASKLLSMPRWKRPLVKLAAASRRIANAVRNKNSAS